MTNNFFAKWEEAKAELAGQMTADTFNQHIAQTIAINYAQNILTLKAPNERSARWMSNGLKDKIHTTARYAFDNPDLLLVITAEDWPGESVTKTKPREERPIETTEVPVEAPPTPPTAHHFEPVINNWVKTPMIYYTHILAANYKPSTKIVIGAVIAHTLGIIDTRGNSPEWWENITITGDLVEATKLSKNSVKAGIEEAIAEGWIKYRKSTQRPEIANDYALRYEGEAAYVQRLEVPN